MRQLVPWLLFGSIFASTTSYAQSSCSSLTTVVLSNATILSAILVDAQSRVLIDPASGEQVTKEVPSYCAVKGQAYPTSDSLINFELWLPVTDWNGRYKQTGNGGWAGVIRTGAMTEALATGYATAGTDTGHQTPQDGVQRWIIGHPEKLVDFGHRAVHLTSVYAKIIIDAYYGRSPAYSYFAGCSEGGREGLMEAQRYADDFDGILIGAPAHDWTNLFTGFVWNEQALLATGTAPLTPAQLTYLQDAI